MPGYNKTGLIVLSSVERLPGGRLGGFWLPEAAYPWLALRCAGWDFAFVSTRPGRPPVGGVDTSDPPQRAFLSDPVVRERLENTTTATDFAESMAADVIFVAGGHGAIMDLPGDKPLARLLSGQLERGGVLAAVCHGVAALLGTADADGKSLLAGRRVTAFTDAEEFAVGLRDVVPYPLAEALTAKGARWESGEPFRSHVVVDGNLVTGQNPASTAALVEAAMLLATGKPLPATWLRPQG